MKRIYYSFFAVLLFLVMSVPVLCTADSPDDITIKDYSGILSDLAKSYMNSKNEILFEKTKAKIIFVTVDSTDGMSAQEYCEELYKTNGMSDFGRINSIFGVIAKNSRDYGFVQGKNISLTFTNELLDEFIVDHFEPDFQKKNYDEAVLKMYNALANWYEEKYNDLDLKLDPDIKSYTNGKKTRDIIETPDRTWLWIGLTVCVVVMLVILKIKRNIELKIRQHERRRLKKKFKIDIDKIVNS